jgi:malate dehydrogenase (oxaloacetate-decarboxylating)(NADP+)
MVRLITNRAKIEPKRIVFAEADHLDVLKAAQIAYEEGICHPILGKQRNHFRTKRVGFYAELEIIDPKIKEEDARRNKFATIGNLENEKEFLFMMLKS